MAFYPLCVLLAFIRHRCFIAMPLHQHVAALAWHCIIQLLNEAGQARNILLPTYALHTCVLSYMNRDDYATNEPTLIVNPNLLLFKLHVYQPLCNQQLSGARVKLVHEIHRSLSLNDGPWAIGTFCNIGGRQHLKKVSVHKLVRSSIFKTPKFQTLPPPPPRVRPRVDIELVLKTSTRHNIDIT